jgi:hypothetical protein
MQRTRAAGQTLTVGELREALASLDDNSDVTAHGRYIELALTSAVSLELAPDVSAPDDDDFAVLMAFVYSIATRTVSAAALRKRANELLQEYGYQNVP